ncbi:MAG: R3H domain-containing nucleic acid-binding protein [Microbacterium sp.]
MSNTADDTTVRPRPAQVDSVEELEQEGDIAADFLEGLLDIVDIDGDLTLDVRAGRAYVSVENENDDALRSLSDPDTVQALQELTRIAVQVRTGRFSRLILDVGGSRDARQRQLEKLVDRAIARLDEGASQASLPPMSSYERKLIHDIVSDRGLVSESYGEGADRHTVIRRA